MGGLSLVPLAEDVVDPPPSEDDALDCCTGALTCWPLLPPSEADGRRSRRTHLTAVTARGWRSCCTATARTGLRCRRT